jgi:methionine-rich copper-binding protein CopC
MTLSRPWIAIAAAILPGIALADPHLVLIDPAAHVTLSHPPDRLRLVFSEPARISDLSIRRSARAAWPLATATVGSATEISLPLPYLMPGTYVVTWHRDTQEGDLVRESTVFSIK